MKHYLKRSALLAALLGTALLLYSLSTFKSSTESAFNDRAMALQTAIEASK